MIRALAMTGTAIDNNNHDAFCVARMRSMDDIRAKGSGP